MQLEISEKGESKLENEPYDCTASAVSKDFCLDFTQINNWSLWSVSLCFMDQTILWKITGTESDLHVVTPSIVWGTVTDQNTLTAIFMLVPEGFKITINQDAVVSSCVLFENYWFLSDGTRCITIS